MGERLMDCATATDLTPANQATILLVEYEERVQLALHAFLQRRGYEVISVGTVAEAEKCITARGIENIAVIVSDIDLHPDAKNLRDMNVFNTGQPNIPNSPSS